MACILDTLPECFAKNVITIWSIYKSKKSKHKKND